MKPSEPVCLSLCSLFVFFKKKTSFIPSVLMSVNHYRKLELFGFWGDDVGWWCIVQNSGKKTKKKKQSIFAAMSFCLWQHRLSLCSQRLTLWWKQLKAASFNHCGLSFSFFLKFAIDWSISRYTGISWCFFGGFFLFFFLSSWLLIWSFEFPDSVL